MTPIVLEWIEKAEADWITAQRECRARKSPNFDAACFHAQQCIEKYLKARLVMESIAFTKTHDLADLLDKLLPLEPAWAALRPSLDTLTSYAVAFRYPGESATREMARTVISDTKDIRQKMRSAFNLQ